MDKLCGFFGYMRAGCCDSCHRVASVERLVASHEVLGHYPGAAELLCDEIYSLLLFEDGEVLGGDHGLYAWSSLGISSVYGEDTSVGMGARQHFAVKHSG